MGHRITAATLFVALSLGACGTITRTGTLYATNGEATAPLKAVFTASGTGHGSVAVLLADGESLTGEYSIVRSGVMGFGSILGSVYGATTSSSVAGTSFSTTIQSASQGIAAAHGTKGTSMQCEFLNDNASGHGYGACKTSTGALYRLLY